MLVNESLKYSQQIRRVLPGAHQEGRKEGRKRENTNYLTSHQLLFQLSLLDNEGIWNSKSTSDLKDQKIDGS